MTRTHEASARSSAGHWVLSTILLASLALLPGCPAKPAQEQVELNIDIERFVVPVRADEIAIGGEQPLVTIVLWSDYACVPCGRSWQVMKHLVEDFGDDLRVVFRAGTVPGFQHGERAAEAAFAAGGQGKFWDMHWRLFEHPEDFSRPVLRKHAEAIGLDVPQFMDDLDTGRYAGPRIQHRRDAAQLGLSPLPAAFVNGLFVLGYKDEPGWHALVERELATARKMMQEGVKRGDIYEKFMDTAKHGRVGSNEEAERLQAQRKAAAEAAKPAQLAGPDTKARYAVPTGAAGWGAADAPVVVVEFVDYQCPYCGKAEAEVLPVLREKYPDRVRIEVRHLPLELHPRAPAAARAALTASLQDKFGEFHERLFAPEAGPLAYSTFVQIAEELGLDAERFASDFQSRAVSDMLAADVLLSRRLGIQGTPAFFVNGRYVNGVHSAETYTTMIDEELARADELLAAGTPAAELHEVLMQGALAPEQFPNAHLAVAESEPKPGPPAEPTPNPRDSKPAGEAGTP